MSRFARKVDANQAAIVKALRQYGAFVQSLASVGKGCPDLLVGYRGWWLLLEVKDGRKVPSARQLTPDEKAWRTAASQVQCYTQTVGSVDEALMVLGHVNAWVVSRFEAPSREVAITEVVRATR